MKTIQIGQYWKYPEDSIYFSNPWKIVKYDQDHKVCTFIAKTGASPISLSARHVINSMERDYKSEMVELFSISEEK
jgi:hypothetical protein